jgi:hypothetical protein
MKICRRFRFMRHGAFGIVDGLTAIPTTENCIRDSAANHIQDNERTTQDISS